MISLNVTTSSSVSVRNVRLLSVFCLPLFKCGLSASYIWAVIGIFAYKQNITIQYDVSRNMPSNNIILDTPFHLELMRVPAGECLMGSDPSKDNFAQPDELPQHNVHLSEFYISKYEITNTQYSVYASTNNIVFEIPAGQNDFPKVFLSWYEAVAFCEWLSHIMGRNVHLPSEAEWEKAARGSAGRLYPWGDPWDRNALNSNDHGIGEMTPVSKHSPAGDSPYGVADLAGNVWEWTADWYGTTTYEERFKSGLLVENPTGPSTGTHRVLRGGSYYFRQGGTRAAKRFKYIPASRCYDIGFRIVVDSQPDA